MRYELGEDLKKLAVIYKIPLTTLNKRKKKAELMGDPWIKNSKSKNAYESFMENDKNRRLELRKEINKVADDEIRKLQYFIDDAYAQDKLLDKDVEEAIDIRSNRIEKLLDLKRKCNDIPSLKEEAEIERAKIEIELKKIMIEEKRLDIEMKKMEANMFKGDDMI